MWQSLLPIGTKTYIQTAKGYQSAKISGYVNESEIIYYVLKSKFETEDIYIPVDKFNLIQD